MWHQSPSRELPCRSRTKAPAGLGPSKSSSRSRHAAANTLVPVDSQMEERLARVGLRGVEPPSAGDSPPVPLLNHELYFRQRQSFDVRRVQPPRDPEGGTAAVSILGCEWVGWRSNPRPRLFRPLLVRLSYRPIFLGAHARQVRPALARFAFDRILEGRRTVRSIGGRDVGESTGPRFEARGISIAHAPSTIRAADG